MDVPFYTTCKADAAVLALLGSPEPRIFPFGQAPQTVAKPYVVYQWIGGDPFNMLNCRPDADRASLQVDVYGLTTQSTTTVAKAIRYAIELDSYVTSYRGDMRDEETKLYRTSFDVDWIVDRN
jgi:hypothetical protein